jgi:UDP-2,3-diacylglucosamine pyrophosphatase LpxH
MYDMMLQASKEMLFRNRVNRKFTKIYKEAKRPENIIPLKTAKDHYVLFSDHHKGDTSAADDFKKNAALYERAVAHYQSKGFKLIVLGDNEELWENHYDQILPHYKALIQKEIDMAPRNSEGKRIRIWGNHDKEVSLGRFRRWCSRRDISILDDVQHLPGICLGESIFLIHGHQGRFFDDKAWRVSRWAVQWIWKSIQRLFHIGIDGPAENYRIRDDLEMNYYRWAKKNRVLLICGHTHRAIFASLTHFDRLHLEVEHLKSRLDEEEGENQVKIKKDLEEKKSQLGRILKRRSGKPPKSFAQEPERPVPCYFNDGCCGYTNGITCIEIEKDIMRLIKRQRQTGERKILVERSLSLLAAYIRDNRAIDGHIEPLLKDHPLD